MSTIDLNSNRGKGQNAYICPIVRYSGHKDMGRAKFSKPKPGQEEKARKKKYFEGYVDISGFSDGWYYYSEATSHGYCEDGLVKIKNGSIIENLGSVNELLIQTVEEFFPSLVPIVGVSVKQTNYAELLRAKLMLKLWEDGYERDIYSSLPCEAKWWIEVADPTSVKARIESMLALENAL